MQEKTISAPMERRGKKMELKPCPFCGCRNIVAEMSNLDKAFHVFCEECMGEMNLSFADALIGNGEFVSFYEMQEIMNKMVEAWNGRYIDGQRSLETG